jgi:2,4-dienoyl-CoA reductase-like NADH-dependent reductase (Old Yellow Enzyme family)
MEDFENRIRLTVQSEWPKDLPLFVRISATDWADGGWNAEVCEAFYNFKEKRS